MTNVPEDLSDQLVFIFRNNRVALKQPPELDRPLGFITSRDLLIARIELSEPHFVFVNDVKAPHLCCEAAPSVQLPNSWVWVGLREIAMLAQHFSEFQQLCQAHQIVQWDKNHRFCGRCGKPTEKHLRERSRYCTECQLSFFPRISPSGIVIVKKEDKILLARSPHFPPGVYGAVAGFVEVGETVEEAVIREVYEEVGIRIQRLQYQFSQPWPFPDSLMLGFTAEYASGEITIDGREIQDANWFGRDHLPKLPMKISIASALIHKILDDLRT